MNKNLVLIFSIVLLSIVSPYLFSQAQNNEQRIVGTWVEENDGKVWIFNANGTGTVDGIALKWGVAQNKIAIVLDKETLVMDYTLSTDGKTLLISIVLGRGYFLKRRN